MLERLINSFTFIYFILAQESISLGGSFGGTTSLNQEDDYEDALEMNM